MGETRRRGQGGSVAERAAAAASANGDGDGAAKTAANTEAEAEARAETKRLVLRRERVLVLPEVMTDEEVAAAVKAIAAFTTVKAAKIKPEVAEGWLVIGEFEGSKLGAIEAYAGKAGTPDAIPGAYKAPTASAMRGGALYEKPPEPKVERSLLD